MVSRQQCAHFHDQLALEVGREDSVAALIDGFGGLVVDHDVDDQVGALDECGGAVCGGRPRIG